MNAWVCDACGAMTRDPNPLGWLLIKEQCEAETVDRDSFPRTAQTVAILCSDNCCTAWAGMRSAVGR